MTRPFRFAVQAFQAGARPEPVTAAQWCALARRTEELGYSTLFVPDHYLDRGRAPTLLAPVTSMTWAAAVTDRLRVGSRVFCVDYHVPAALAKEVATLDLLSGGRLEVGLGAGWSEAEYQAMGVPFEAPGRRVTRLEEVIALIKAHCAGADLDLRGEFVNVSGYAGVPLPEQRPHPPIMVGGGKPRVLALAAREADIVSFSNVPVNPAVTGGRAPHDIATERLGVVRDAAGARFDALDLEMSPYFFEITDDPGDALRRTADWLGVPEDGLLDHPNVLIGTEAEIVDRLLARRDDYGFNYITVPQTVMEEFAPVAARLRNR